MAKAWHTLTKAAETGKAEAVKQCALRVFGVTAFELAMEDVMQEDNDEEPAAADAESAASIGSRL